VKLGDLGVKLGYLGVKLGNGVKGFSERFQF
jgi:hypothetical protein